MESNTARAVTEAGPGAWLRQARLDRGLSIEEVSRSLNLSLRHLQSLESDDYERLPAPTYVRGYLRGYALLLGMSPQPLLDAFNRLPIAAQRNEMVAPAPVRQVTSSDTLVKFGTVMVAGLVIGLAALWWGGKDSSTPRRRPPPTAVAPASVPVSAPVSLEPLAEVGGAPVDAIAKFAPEQNPPVAAPIAPTKTPEPLRVAPALEKRTPVSAPSPAITVIGMAEKPAVSVNAPIDPNQPRARLVLRLIDESWADVRDADDRRLLYQTIAAGQVISVEGVAPLNVFLGKVDAVRVEFNGQPYDAQRHKRGEIARFTLGTAAPRP